MLFLESLENLPNSNQLINTVEHNELSAVRPVKFTDELVDDQMENMICEFSHVHVEHSNAVPYAKSLYYPRCFIHERMTHLHKSPRQNQPNGHTNFTVCSIFIIFFELHFVSGKSIKKFPLQT